MYFHVEGSDTIVCLKAERPKFSPQIFIAHLTYANLYSRYWGHNSQKTDKVLNLMEFLF